MVKRVNNNEIYNINNSDTNKVINTYTNGDIKRIVTVKTYKYCEKCLKRLPEGSLDAFCDFSCRQEYFAENAREMDSVWREISGRD